MLEESENRTVLSNSSWTRTTMSEKKTNKQRRLLCIPIEIQSNRGEITTTPYPTSFCCRQRSNTIIIVVRTYAYHPYPYPYPYPFPYSYSPSPSPSVEWDIPSYFISIKRESSVSIDTHQSIQSEFSSALCLLFPNRYVRFGKDDHTCRYPTNFSHSLPNYYEKIIKSKCQADGSQSS